MPDTTRQLNCRFCGKRFVTNHGIKKYCSDECRITYWRNDAGSQARKRTNAAEYSSDIDVKARRSARHQERYRSDPAYRERILQSARKLQSSEGYREKRNETRRHLYATDPEFREKERRLRRQDYASRCLDPEFLAQVRERGRRHRAKQKLGDSLNEERMPPDTSTDSSS